MHRAQKKRPGDRFPELKYCKLPTHQLPEERQRISNDLLDLWEDKFERNIADLVRESTADGYQVKIEGWEYSRVRGRAVQQVTCRVAMVSTENKMFATYRFFPFLDKAEAVAPEADSPARITLDQVLQAAGYAVVGRYNDRAA